MSALNLREYHLAVISMYAACGNMVKLEAALTGALTAGITVNEILALGAESRGV